MNSLLILIALVIGYFMMSDKSLQNQVQNLQPIHYIGVLIVTVFVCNMNQKEGLCSDSDGVEIPEIADAADCSQPNVWTTPPQDEGLDAADAATATATAADPVVNCVESGNTPADCLEDCLPVTATPGGTPASGNGTPCVGTYICLPGDGACPDDNSAAIVVSVVSVVIIGGIAAAAVVKWRSQ